MTEQILYIGGGLIAGGVLVWALTSRRSTTDDTSEHIAELHKQMHQQMAQMNDQIDKRLQENARAMHESKDFVANRVSAAEKSVRSVAQGLGKLEQATGQLQRASDEIVSFQNMLKSPKVRGSFGEVLLGNLLADVLPADRFELQYTMAGTGDIADAIVRLQDGHIVAVDAKFPLANYEAYAQEEDGERRRSLRKQFVRDVKKHVKDISDKYIIPEQKTLDYAFMYIPIEGVYYETMVRPPEHDAASEKENEGLWEFCLARHVIPVSPNSFLAYLQTVLVGLRGMKIEQQAREILQHLNQLNKDFGQFAEEFQTVGTHLTNAKNRYDGSARRLDKFATRLEQIGESSTPALSAAEDENSSDDT